MMLRTTVALNGSGWMALALLMVSEKQLGRRLRMGGGKKNDLVGGGMWWNGMEWNGVESFWCKFIVLRCLVL